MTETYAIVARHKSEHRMGPMEHEDFTTFVKRVIAGSDYGDYYILEVHRDGETVLDNREDHPMSDDYTRPEELLED